MKLRMTVATMLAAIGLMLSGCTYESTSKVLVDSNPSSTTEEKEQVESASQEDSDSEEKVAKRKPKKPEAAGYIFATPVRIKAGDKYVAVESPGYACPTMADVDGDGKQDLVVGQFANGNMQFCKNIGSKTGMPEFAKPEWLKTGEERAVVPGVW